MASFITPNHPCIAPIVKRASEHLVKLCGSGDFSGYLCADKLGNCLDFTLVIDEKNRIIIGNKS